MTVLVRVCSGEEGVEFVRVGVRLRERERHTHTHTEREKVCASK